MRSVLPRLGIGGASIDISFARPRSIQGEPVDTEIVVRGGSVAQEVRKLAFTLVVRTDDRRTGQEFTVQEEEIPAPFTIEPDETRNYPMSLYVPDTTPVTTLGDTALRLSSELDLVRARNGHRHTTLEVLPSPALTAILEEFEKLGLVLIDEVVRDMPVGSTATERVDWNQVFLFRVSGAPFDEWMRRVALTISRRVGERQVSLATGGPDSDLDDLLYRTTDVGHHRFAIGDNLLALSRMLEDHVYEALPRSRQTGGATGRFGRSG